MYSLSLVALHKLVRPMSYCHRYCFLNSVSTIRVLLDTLYMFARVMYIFPYISHFALYSKSLFLIICLVYSAGMLAVLNSTCSLSLD
jgi:hypothetical protein